MRQIAPLQLWIVKAGDRIDAGYRMPIGEQTLTQMRSNESSTACY